MIHCSSKKCSTIITGELRGSYTLQQRAKVNKLLECVNRRLFNDSSLYAVKPYKLNDIYRFIKKYMQKYNITDTTVGINEYAQKIKENDYLIPKEGL